MQTALKRALNRTVDFFFAYGVVASAHIGKPHLHGSLLATASELRRVRMALHQINGVVSKDFKRYAVRLSAGVRRRAIEKHGALHSNLYWALYCMKERGAVRWEYLVNQQNYTATQDITKAAKTYYALCYAYEQSPPIPLSKQSIKVTY